MLGMYGMFEVNKIMYNVDCIIVLGVCFDDCVINNVDKFCLYVDIIYVDIDLVLIFKIVNVYIFVVGLVDKVFD